MGEYSKFASYHPLVNFIYFTVVLLISMFSMHPVLIVLSLVISMVYGAYLKGVKKTLKGLIQMLAMAALIMLINPLFNHEGMTILWYFPNGNPLTAEAMIYGLFMAMMLLSLLQWFICYNQIMSTDKFLYLFGKVSPRFSLLISMTFGLIPRFSKEFQEITQAQQGLGENVARKGIFQKMQRFVAVTSMMISWSMENSIERADSMKGRGYGLSGRTTFSIYAFTKRDGVVLAGMGMLLAGFLGMLFYGALDYRYYPTFAGELFSIEKMLGYGLFAALCLVPLGLELGNKYGYREENLEHH